MSQSKIALAMLNDAQKKEYERDLKFVQETMSYISSHMSKRPATNDDNPQDDLNFIECLIKGLLDFVASKKAREEREKYKLVVY